MFQNIKRYIYKIIFVLLVFQFFIPHTHVRATAWDTTTDSQQRREQKKDVKAGERRGTAIGVDSLAGDTVISTKELSVVDSLKSDSTAPKAFLDDIIKTKNQDSLVFNVKNSNIKMYNKGEVLYKDKNLSADYIEMILEKDLIYAKGVPDSVGVYTKTNFKDGGSTYDMDSIIYNIKTEKGKIKGVAFKEGEGTLRGREIKKTEDGIMNVKGGTFSTCDAECPHFYLAMTKAQFVDGKNSRKAIFGPSYIVLEDVPLPIGLPFGFVPLSMNRKSGFIMPEVGEENMKGFFLRGGGYYFVFNDYMDLAARAGIYTLGSWEASLNSTYKKRYKYNGNFGFNYANNRWGEQGASDYTNMNNYRLTWTHQQDAKFKPNSTFSANVNFSSSNYNKYDAVNINEYVSAQTNSSVSYSKSWAGTPFSLSVNMQHSQNNRDSSIVLSLPNFVFNVARIFPFQRKEAVGAQKWYEKISMSYNNNFNNNVRTKQDELFKDQMFKDMKYGMKHEIPVTTSFNLFSYLNFSPSIGYTERWYFSKVNKEWDPALNSIVAKDTTNGFFRVYDYRFSGGFSTRVYGDFKVKNNKDKAIKAMRHVMTPSVNFSYTPDFSKSKYGYYKPIQIDSTGQIGSYSPFENSLYGMPGKGRNASMSFSLGNTLEMKVRSKTDTTGTKILKIFENLQLSSSYNFLADSLNLQPFSLTARTTLFKTLGLNFSATFDPYSIDSRGRKINRFAIKDGQLARMTSASLSFGYSFRSVFGSDTKGTGSQSLAPMPNPEQQNFFAENNINAIQQQQIMQNRYYDFSIPWNLSFNYNFSYSNSGLNKNVTQTVAFNGSVNLTPKFGVSFNSGFDIQARKLTPGSIALTRDLHCWQMSFTWVPVGFRKSWNFSIRVKSGMLSDLKYKKSSGYMNNFYDSYY